MQNLNIAIIQNNIIWEDAQSNYTQFEKAISYIEKQVDLIVLPETFTAGFTPNLEQAITPKEEVIAWLLKQSKIYNSAITGSVVVINEDNNPVNRLYFVTPAEQVYYYDKRHLFVLSEEASILTPGSKRKTINYKGWRILPTICFDLRFPVWNCNSNDYDIMLNIANWPEKRFNHWRKLLQARAIENQSYVIGCNRIGEDGMGISYRGDSMCINFDGEIKAELPVYQSGIVLHTFNKLALDNYRESFQVLACQDNFTIIT